MLQATRPDGPRDVDVARLVKDRVDWERARRVASELGVRDKFETFYRLVCMT